jgi:hypothetical protein
MPIADEKLINQYASIHSSKRYGQGTNDLALHIQACLLDLKPGTVLEYGCGQSLLYKNLILDGTDWVRYDPAIPALSEISIDKADMVVNTDVLEHIPEADIDDVLKHIRSFSPNVFFNISTRLAREILPDGTNAHCTVWDADTWLARLRRFFPDSSLVHVRPGYSCMLVTWESPIIQVLARIEELSLAHRAYTTPVLKKFERKVRRFRNKLLRR